MSSEDPPDENSGRFARRLRAKKLLRFVPRRAVMHKYPFVGRFAEFARRRAYLWSFRTEDLRPSFYAGSILSLLPVMGVQIPVALVLSLALRGNFMVMGGLQFITNPFTAAPIYITTHQLGSKIIELSGFGHSLPVSEEVSPETTPNTSQESQELHLPEVASPEAPPVHWTRKVGTALNALVIGGIVAGTILGGALDLLWKYSSAVHHRPSNRRRRGDSNSTAPQPPPE